MRPKAVLNNQEGFALIVAVLILFAATILGLMVINSSDVEILLSGAQQRYENNLNVAEGAASTEAMAVGSSATITRTVAGVDYTRNYAVINPAVSDQVLSPQDPTAVIFDPGQDFSAVVAYSDADSATWPMENLIQSDTDSDDGMDYHYRTMYRHATGPPKGYDATKFSGYVFEISAQRTTLIELGGTKVGPKMSM